jgi:hypothetical protein
MIWKILQTYISDYLISSTSYTTPTGISNLLNIKHDKVTEELSKRDYDSKFLWQRVKQYVQELTQSKDTITLSFDDSIEEKLYTDDNALHCWNYDHSFNRSLKGVNFLTALFEVGGIKLPVGGELVKKDTWEFDSKTGKNNRKASVTKNELFRKIKECNGKFHFDYVLADSWYSSAENMICCKDELNKYFKMILRF